MSAFCTKSTFECLFMRERESIKEEKANVSRVREGANGLFNTLWLSFNVASERGLSPIFSQQGRQVTPARLWLKNPRTAPWFSTQCGQQIEEPLNPLVIKTKGGTHIVPLSLWNTHPHLLYLSAGLHYSSAEQARLISWSRLSSLNNFHPQWCLAHINQLQIPWLIVFGQSASSVCYKQMPVGSAFAVAVAFAYYATTPNSKSKQSLVKI